MKIEKDATNNRFSNSGTGLFVIILCLSSLILTPDILSASIYYVSTNGNDNNSGASTVSAWKTIQKAADNARAGDTVYIKAGNYGNENISLQFSGSSGNPITFEGYRITPGDNPDCEYAFGDALDATKMPLLDGVDRTTAGKACYLYGNNYIVIKNIQIKNYNIGIFAPSSDYCVFENIIAVDLGNPEATYDGRGIVVGSNANHNQIKQCFVANACAEGISAIGNFNIIDNCKVYCNDGRSIESAMDYYIIVEGYYNTVTGCYVERVGNLPHGGHGIELKKEAEFNVIKNSISVNQTTCFSVRQRGVTNNLFENCTALGTGTAGFGVRDGASNNTFKNCRSSGVTRGASFYDTTEDEGAQFAGSGNRFENCIFENATYCISFFYYNLESAAYDNHFINCVFSGAQYLFESERTNHDNTLTNCIFTDIDEVINASDPYPLDFECTYSNFWNNGFAQLGGTGNFSSNPLFKNPAAGDYHLLTGSPCIDAGTNVCLSFDADGQLRPQGSGYDVGAYEYPNSSPYIYLKTDEGSGTCVSDEITNIPDGTITGASWCSGLSGYGISFDGIDDGVDLGDVIDLGLADRSISLWFKTTATYGCLLSKGYSKTSNQHAIYIDNGNLRCLIDISGTDYIVTSTGAVNDGNWHHATVTIDRDGLMTLYLDGEAEASRDISPEQAVDSQNDYHFYLGRSHYGQYYNGVIDEVKIFLASLSPVEVFCQFAGIFIADLNECSGSIVKDASINENNGTLAGACWVDGISGGALEFDGLDDGVNMGDVLDIGLADRSISLWFKTTAISGCLLSKGYSRTSNQHSIYLENGYMRCLMDISGTDCIVTSTSQVNDGEWHHIVLTIDRDGSMDLYLDGEHDDSTGISPDQNVDAQNSYSFYLGRSHYGQYFAGCIDEVKIFNAVLSLEKIEELHNGE